MPKKRTTTKKAKARARAKKAPRYTSGPKKGQFKKRGS